MRVTKKWNTSVGMWDHCIVPVSMEIVALDSNRSHIFVRNLHALGVCAGIAFGADAKPGFGCGGSNRFTIT
jgi:hypothetical protein